jgi:hypothetical protein
MLFSGELTGYASWQAKDISIAMSRKLEVVALQIANRGWNNFFRLS